MSCKLSGKVTSVSVNINFGARMSLFYEKKIYILGEMLTFLLSVHYNWKLLSFCKICLFLVKCDFLSEGLYTLIECQIRKKNIQFLRYVNLYMC